jgi:hypothetical protein
MIIVNVVGLRYQGAIAAPLTVTTERCLYRFCSVGDTSDSLEFVVIDGENGALGLHCGPGRARDLDRSEQGHGAVFGSFPCIALFDCGEPLLHLGWLASNAATPELPEGVEVLIFGSGSFGLVAAPAGRDDIADCVLAVSTHGCAVLAFEGPRCSAVSAPLVEDLAEFGPCSVREPGDWGVEARRLFDLGRLGAR